MYIIKSRSIVSTLGCLAKHRIVNKVRLRDFYNLVFQMAVFSDASLKDINTVQKWLQMQDYFAGF